MKNSKDNFAKSTIKTCSECEQLGSDDGCSDFPAVESCGSNISFYFTSSFEMALWVCDQSANFIVGYFRRRK